MKRSNITAIALFISLAGMLATATTSSADDEVLVATGQTLTTSDYTTCAITPTGNVTCWGRNAKTLLSPPADLGIVTEIDAGDSHVCAVTLAKEARCWGSNEFGQTNVPNNLSQIVQLSAGANHTCALNEAGQIICWGKNDYEQSTVPGNLGKVLQVSAGSSETCVVTQNQYASCFGFFGLAQANVPGNLGRIFQVSVGLGHTCALTVTREVRCWGTEIYDEATPPANLGATLQVKAGWLSTCAIDLVNSLNCWGTDSFQHSSTPKDIGPAVAVSSGVMHTCIQTVTGTVRCWGSNLYGQTQVPVDLAETLLPVQTLVNSPRPSVGGVFKVGSLLTVDPGVWDEGASLSIQWIRDGNAISSATGSSYLLTAADAGRQVGVRVTGSLSGYKSLVQNNAPMNVSLGDLIQSPKPLVGGVFKVGSLLTVDPGVWDEGASLSIQWIRDGNAISSATGSSYLLTAADAGRQVGVRVTGSLSGYTPMTSNSTAYAVPLADFLNPKAPSISGKFKVGAELKATCSAWAKNSKISFQWLLDGKNITKATSANLKLTSLFKGKKVSVRVTQSLQGFNTKALSSSANKVG